MSRIRFECGGRSYAAFDKPIALLDRKFAQQSYPVVVIVPSSEPAFDLLWLEKEMASMLRVDDVLVEQFFEKIIVCPEEPHDDAQGEDDGDSLSHVTIGQCHVSRVARWRSAVDHHALVSGPYLLHDAALYQVYRLYSDPQRAFVFGVTDDGGSPPTFQIYPDGLIPIPSRLYYPPPDQHSPLRGKRIAIKDVFDMTGTPTAASCRDRGDFYGNVQQTAPMVRRLMIAGAVIVGKTKTAQFASGERARDWVDESCPLNPRGDGFMEPDCSSTGSAVAVAAYEWLDFSVGSDTLGSMTGPAACQGIFGIRPTHGISDLEGVLPVSKHLDTVGFFARSVTDFGVFGASWYDSPRPTKQPTSILYAADEFSKFPEDARSQMDAFVRDLERITGLTKTPFDVSTAWKENANPAGTQQLEEFLATTLARIQLFGSYNHNAAFREAYMKGCGREPKINPMIHFKWNLGSRLTLEDYETALGEQRAYRNFLRQHVFDSLGKILVLPCGRPKAQYVNVYEDPYDASGFPLQGFGFQRDLYSFLGGLPQLVIPVASVSRVSPVTHRVIQEPVTVSLVGVQGTERTLMELAERVLRESGRPLEVLPGSSLFPN